MQQDPTSKEKKKTQQKIKLRFELLGAGKMAQQVKVLDFKSDHYPKLMKSWTLEENYNHQFTKPA